MVSSSRTFFQATDRQVPLAVRPPRVVGGASPADTYWIPGNPTLRRPDFSFSITLPHCCANGENVGGLGREYTPSSALQFSNSSSPPLSSSISIVRHVASGRIFFSISILPHSGFPCPIHKSKQALSFTMTYASSHHGTLEGWKQHQPGAYPPHLTPIPQPRTISIPTSPVVYRGKESSTSPQQKPSPKPLTTAPDPPSAPSRGS